MLLKALDRVERDEIAVVDTPPGNERLLAKAIEQASIVVIPTRVGGVETPRVEAVLDLVPTKVPVGLAICSARRTRGTTRTWSPRGSRPASPCGAAFPSG